MSDKDDTQPEPQHIDPWAPPVPERRVPLDKPGTAPAPAVPQQAHPVPLAPPFAGAAAGVPAQPAPGAPQPGVVPPVPLAPTGPGTPSAYAGAPYGYGQPGPYPQQAPAPYGPGPGVGPVPYGQDPYGQGPYGQTGYGTGAYGYPAAAYGQGWPAPVPAPNNSLGVTALVLGIVGTVLSPTVVFGVILGVLAIVFGAMGRTKAGTGEATNGGQALAGLILGGVALLATALMLVFLITADDDAGDLDDDPDEAVYGAYMSAPPGPGPLLPAAARR
ncbi:hypothetical protein ABZ419_16540 [Streptomyces cinnamoneus]|uniref:DUF4190 domain-containing protein n=1 Tax=Streptomyces cinnamoneus TaxID=53446 RepID=UPI0033E85D1F